MIGVSVKSVFPKKWKAFPLEVNHGIIFIRILKVIPTFIYFAFNYL